MTAPQTRIDKRRADRKGTREAASAPQADPGPSHNRAWDEHNAGSGGEGLSKGYGGSAGTGTGPAGPEGKTTKPERRRQMSRKKK